MSRHVVTQWIGGRWFLAEDLAGGRQWSVHNFATAAEALEFGKRQGWRPRLEVGGRDVSELERRLLEAIGRAPNGLHLEEVAKAAGTSIAAARKALAGRDDLAILEEAKRPGRMMIVPTLAALAVAAALRSEAAA